MRELEELVKEILDELDYLKKQEEIHQHESSVLFLSFIRTPQCSPVSLTGLDESARAKLCLVHALLPRGSGCVETVDRGVPNGTSVYSRKWTCIRTRVKRRGLDERRSKSLNS
jgi:hypothetical protein